MDKETHGLLNPWNLVGNRHLGTDFQNCPLEAQQKAVWWNVYMASAYLC